jgi:hypothetical protein
MITKKQQNYFFYYLLKDNDQKYIYSIKNCIYPKRTKDYKKLDSLLYNNIVKTIGFCDEGFYNTYKPKFHLSNNNQ